MRDTIEMAREVGFHVGDQFVAGASEAELERLVAIVRADERSIEREACAKVCDSWSLRDSLAAEMAEEIRARGETK
jgi:hypothetical protein